MGGPAHPVATLSPRPRPWREQLLFGASCADLSCPPHPSTDAFAGLGFPKSSLHVAQQPVTAAAGVKPCLAHGRLAGHSASVSLPLPWLRCPLLTGLLPPPCCAISASATAAVCCAPGMRRSSEEPGARAGGAGRGRGGRLRARAEGTVAVRGHGPRGAAPRASPSGRLPCEATVARRHGTESSQFCPKAFPEPYVPTAGSDDPAQPS